MTDDPATKPCGACGKTRCHEYEFTCSTCLLKARELIDTIQRLDAKVSDEAAEKGDATGELVLLSGAVANPDAYRQRRRYGYQDHWERNKAGERYRPDVIGQEHPLWTLGMWDLLVRETLGTKSSEVATVANCADYLRDNLWLLARDPDFGFAEMKTELATCARHLENVLSEGVRRERGVPCMYDGRVLTRDLEFRWDRDGMRWVYTDWECSKCDRTWTAEEYGLNVLEMTNSVHVEAVHAFVGGLPVQTDAGAYTWCSIKHAAEQVGRSEGCVKGWASKHEWERMCLVAGRRQGFVRLAQVVEHAEQAGRRDRKAAA